MRIISDFHDFYDVVQAMGQDRSLIYIRKQEEIELKNNPFPKLSTYRIWGDEKGLNLDQYIVGFAGKIYPVVGVSKENCYDPKEAVYCFSLQEIDDFVVANFREKQVAAYMAKKNNWKSRGWPYYQKHVDFEKFFKECADRQNKYEAFFLEHACPVFLAKYNKRDNVKLVRNGCLKEVEFFRKIDPYTAFQELQMYWGGLAHPLKPIPKISDEDMVEIKGFDPKWSFRKEPSKKR